MHKIILFQIKFFHFLMLSLLFLKECHIVFFWLKHKEKRNKERKSLILSNFHDFPSSIELLEKKSMKEENKQLCY